MKIGWLLFIFGKSYYNIQRQTTDVMEVNMLAYTYVEKGKFELRDWIGSRMK